MKMKRVAGGGVAFFHGYNVDLPTLQSLLENPDVRETCDALLEKALEQGGRDNITIDLSELK